MVGLKKMELKSGNIHGPTIWIYARTCLKYLLVSNNTWAQAHLTLLELCLVFFFEIGRGIKHEKQQLFLFSVVWSQAEYLPVGV